MQTGQLIELLAKYPATRVLVSDQHGKLSTPGAYYSTDLNAVVINVTKEEYRHSRVIDQDQKARELHEIVDKTIERGKSAA
jgi:hypothetical protein